MFLIILLLLIGCFAGVLTGLMGSSGVLVVIPGVILLGYSAHQAVGISLAVDMIASIIVMITYHQHGRVNLRDGMWIAIAAVAGALIGARLTRYVPEVGLSGGYGILLLVNAVVFWRRGAKRDIRAYRKSGISHWLNRHVLFSSIAIGLSIGTFSGMFGVGGGLMFMIALVILGYPLHRAVGTSTMIMALTTASGTLGHALIGNLPLKPVLWATLGTCLGSFGSAMIANRLSEENLGKLVAVVFGVLGVAMFITPLYR